MRFGSLVVVLALTLVGCKNDDPNTADYWIDRLAQRSERAEALKQLGKLGDKSAVPEIVKWLQKDGEWQADAAYALGQLGDPASVAELIAILDPSAQKSAHQK